MMKAEPLFPFLNSVRFRIGCDGAGVTTLIAGAGCPLKCRWCINERLLREAPVRMVDADTLYDMVKVDDLYFQATGGGVTFGGGESLLHADFLTHFRSVIPKAWKVNVETSLAVPAENVRKAAGSVDMFIVDCKDMNGDIYRSYTGGDPELMKNNLRCLLKMAGPDRILVRVPKIPDFNTKADQNKSAALLREMGVTQLNLFDYVKRQL